MQQNGVIIFKTIIELCCLKKEDYDDDDDEQPDETPVFFNSSFSCLAWSGKASFFVWALRLTIGFLWSAE